MIFQIDFTLCHLHCCKFIFALYCLPVQRNLSVRNILQFNRLYEKCFTLYLFKFLSQQISLDCHINVQYTILVSFRGFLFKIVIR